MCFSAINRANLFIEFGKNIVQLEISKLLENFIFTFTLGHESIQVRVREFGQIRKFSSMIELSYPSRLYSLGGSLWNIWIVIWYVVFW